LIFRICRLEWKCIGQVCESEISMYIYTRGMFDLRGPCATGRSSLAIVSTIQFRHLLYSINYDFEDHVNCVAFLLTLLYTWLFSGKHEFHGLSILRPLKFSIFSCFFGPPACGKGPMNSCLSVCPSVCAHNILFWNWLISFFWKLAWSYRFIYVQKGQSPIFRNILCLAQIGLNWPKMSYKLTFLNLT